MRIAIVGCGFVADYYMKTLPLHPQLQVVGGTDRDEERATRFANRHSVLAYPSLDDLLADPKVELVLNLTNPRSHFTVSRACLLAGKHVYSEKPLAMTVSEAEELVSLAEEKGVQLSAAPSRLLGVTAQTMWKALRQGTIGTAWLAYAELDDGLVHRMPYKSWLSESGIPWPYKDEFETGCTLEHAGYAVTWMVAFFGPAESVSAFSSCLIPDKESDLPLDVTKPDFSVGCIRFASGQVARVTNSIVAPRNHSIRVFGDGGILFTGDCWKPHAPVYVRRRLKIRRRIIDTPWRTRVPMPQSRDIPKRVRGFKKVDYLLGASELAASVRENRPCRLSARFCLHVTEIVIAIHDALESSSTVKIRSSFDPIEPMPWAK
jgi:predicted dehydrogenase